MCSSSLLPFQEGLGSVLFWVSGPDTWSWAQKPDSWPGGRGEPHRAPGPKCVDSPRRPLPAAPQASWIPGWPSLGRALEWPRWNSLPFRPDGSSGVETSWPWEGGGLRFTLSTQGTAQAPSLHGSPWPHHPCVQRLTKCLHSCPFIQSLRVCPSTRGKKTEFGKWTALAQGHISSKKGRTKPNSSDPKTELLTTRLCLPCPALCIQLVSWPLVEPISESTPHVAWVYDPGQASVGETGLQEGTWGAHTAQGPLPWWLGRMQWWLSRNSPDTGTMSAWVEAKGLDIDKNPYRWLETKNKKYNWPPNMNKSVNPRTIKKCMLGKFLCSPTVRILHFHYHRPGFSPWSGN